MQKTTEPGTCGELEQFRLASRGHNYAPGGFWRRFAAVFIDSAILGIVLAPLQIGLTFGLTMYTTSSGQEVANSDLHLGLIGVYWLLQFAAIYFYYGWFYVNKGATPGKMLLGLKVVDEKTGTHIGYLRTFGREAIGKILSGLLLLIGYLMAAFNKDKKALHDIVFGTRVIRKL